MLKLWKQKLWQVSPKRLSFYESAFKMNYIEIEWINYRSFHIFLREDKWIHNYISDLKFFTRIV